MAAYSYPTTKETTNYARVCRLVLDIVPDLLRELLTARLPASGIQTALTNQNDMFRQLNKQQKSILRGTVKDFDLSLLYILLRHIVNIPPHTNGWGKVPDVADRSLSANIDRLRFQRNGVAHSPNACLSDSDFKSRWDTIRQSVEEIETKELKTGGSFVEKIDDLLTQVMDNTTVLRNAPRQAAIERTIITVNDETSRSEIISTQALEDAKELIRKKGLAVIRGTSGDGKTMMCYQLLKWLMDDENNVPRLPSNPLQIYKMSQWDDFVETKAELALFIDDINGDIAEELKRRKDDIQSALKKKCYCLILNVRDDIFKSSLLSSCELFHEENIIDLRGKNSMKTEEKLLILEKYVPNINIISGGKEYEIVDLAPNIGFPQCCRLYRDVPDLQKEGVDFFNKPFYFMEKTFKEKLPNKCRSSLRFLFLSGGVVRRGDVDPNNEYIDKKMVEEAFSGQESPRDKIRLLREGLDEMSQSLISFEDECYKFCHDSVQDTVALMYGNVTPIGFVENCPRKYLRYISTPKSAPSKILISEHEYLYKRLYREFLFDYRHYKYFGGYIVSLGFWTDVQFLQGFIKYLNSQTLDVQYFKRSKRRCKVKLALLNGVCSSGSDDSAVFLLSEGVKPDEDTPYYAVKGGSKNILKRVFRTVSNKKKTPLLNKTCSFGSDDCALFLLSEGVIPDKDTPFRAIEGGCVNVLRKLLECDVTPTARTGETSHCIWDINVLQQACLFEREEMLTLFNERYPNLIQEKDTEGQSILHLVAATENCALTVFQTAEKSLLKSLNKNEDEQDNCEMVEDHVVHQRCKCAQYMCELVDKHGKTVLHTSCMSGNIDICKYLCKSFPDLTTVLNKRDETILHACCYGGLRDICKYLCESFPALTSLRNTNGETVLHASCYGDHIEVCSYLCESFPALMGELNNKGESILHVSCWQGSKHVFKYLCDTFPALTAIVSNDGRHCLHYIARARRSDLDMFTECEDYVRQYLESTGRQYDITNILDNEGKSILDLRAERAEIFGRTNDRLYDYIVSLFGQETH